MVATEAKIPVLDSAVPISTSRSPCAIRSVISAMVDGSPPTCSWMLRAVRSIAAIPNPIAITVPKMTVKVFVFAATSASWTLPLSKASSIDTNSASSRRSASITDLPVPAVINV